MWKLSFALLAATAISLGSCSRDVNDNVTATKVERETRRAIERGESFVERKADRTQQELSDRFSRFEANEKSVQQLRGQAKKVRGGVDETLAAIDAQAKQLEARFAELEKKAASATEKEWRELERELDALQAKLDQTADAIRADLKGE